MIAARLLTLLAFVTLPFGPVLALSCMPYSSEQAFQDASDSPDRYIVVHGMLDFNPADLPLVDMTHQELIAPETLFGATLTGFSLTGSGFDARFVRQIRVNVQCYGPWCGSLTPGREHLTFLKREGGGYLLEINPCGGFAFANPSRALLGKIHECLLGADCEPPQY